MVYASSLSTEWPSSVRRQWECSHSWGSQMAADGQPCSCVCCGERSGAGLIQKGTWIVTSDSGNCLAVYVACSPLFLMPPIGSLEPKRNLVLLTPLWQEVENFFLYSLVFCFFIFDSVFHFSWNADCTLKGARDKKPSHWHVNDFYLLVLPSLLPPEVAAGLCARGRVVERCAWSPGWALSGRGGGAAWMPSTQESCRFVLPP